MAFLTNSAVNRANLHYAIQALAMGAGGVFFLAYLLHAGVSVPVTLLTQVAIVACRYGARQGVLPLARRFGLKPLLIAGALMMGAQYPLLSQVRGVDGWLAATVVMASVGDALYWPCYHAFFAALGDSEARGRQIGAREAAAAAVGVVAPLLGAWMLTRFGPLGGFGVVALIQAASALPLLGAPNIGIERRPAPERPQARMAMALFVADGWTAACFFFVWQVVLFISLGRNLAAYGGAAALAALAGAAAGLMTGRFIDLGHGRRAALIANLVFAVAALLRAASVGSPWLAVGANALGAFVATPVVAATMTAVYNLAKASPCALRFHVAIEGGWDLGCAAGCLTAAGLIAAGAPLSAVIGLTVLGAGANAALLWRHYAAGASDDAAVPA
ncbi:MFS transporter [Caulobacter sp. KR2-114]|uniref:MFS transporter n=1 Tax=Caulobacter sp. KR2-114 TaxID=3400912 RepID=UPI003C02D0AD